MILKVIYIYCIGIVLGNHELFSAFVDSTSIYGGNLTTYRRSSRDANKDFETKSEPNCEQMTQTKATPFVVLLLFQTSGRFLGMGSILDRTTVLTAAKAVENSAQTPHDLLVLGGRLGPWWGKNSQVKKTDEILLNDDANMAIVKLKEPFKFDKYVAPIRIPLKKSDAFETDYDVQYAVFGIVRSPFDVPGDLTPKSTIYIMKIETLCTKSEDLDPCKGHFKDRDFDPTINICTIANGTYCWGCIGSPTVAIDKNGKVLQVATITRAPIEEDDKYHVHTKIGQFEQWIRSQSYVTYKD